jgi:hypothetical protein
MQRNWDIIKAILMELEPLNSAEGKNYQVHYTGAKKSSPEDIHKFEMVSLLLDKGFIQGVRSKSLGVEFKQILNLTLTWEGHDLLDILNDNKVWSKIKEVALNKGIEVTFSTLKVLHSAALTQILG